MPDTNLPATIGGFIPQSTALAEAQPDSIQECMSSDPESERFRRALPRMVEVLRAQRLRWMEGEGQKREAKQGGGQKALAAALKATTSSADDLGF